MRSVRSIMASSAAIAVATTSLFIAPAAYAQDETAQNSAALGEIVVTAQRREENLQDVPLSVTAVSGDQLGAITAGGVDIRGISGRVPSLLVESSFGRTFPRFYIRGLGNTDFDFNASQPVSLIYDDVVLENPILKGFPIFDMERVEVLRGPQGTQCIDLCLQFVCNILYLVMEFVAEVPCTQSVLHHRVCFLQFLYSCF